MTVIIILLAAAAAITLYCHRIAFYSNPKKRSRLLGFNKKDPSTPEDFLMEELMQEMRTEPYEKISTTAYDGLTLNGRYYHTRDGAPMHIQFHGYRGSIDRDICGGLRIARTFGFNTIIIEQRAHGESLGRNISFGVKERHDVLSWINYAIERFGEDLPIFVSGISMGGATVLMASELPLPQNVKAIMADCPYTSPEAIIAKVCKQDMHLPPAVCMPFIKLAARLLGGFKLTESSAVEAVRNAKVPILLMHGAEDEFVPTAMSAEIEAACASPCTRVTFPKAGHGMAYVTDPARYNEVAREFLSPLISLI